jgi:hypothetical protein
VGREFEKDKVIDWRRDSQCADGRTREYAPGVLAEILDPPGE